MKTKITRVVSFAAAAVVMFANVGSTRYIETSEADAAGTMTAAEITKNMQFGWNLGNTFDSYLKDDDGNLLYNCGLETETCWGNPKATKEMIHAVKAKGFSTIRIPTTWFQHVDESNNYKINPEWLARVKEVVDWSLDEGLYVIINMHHEEGWQNSYTLGQDYNRIKPFVTSVWAQLSETFKDYDQHLIFEAMNEPRAVGQTYEWWAATAPKAECEVINKLNADIVKTIRGTSANNDVRLIMLPSYCASSDPTFMNENIIPSGDPYLAASVHAYSPYNFTMNNEVEDHSKFTAAYKNELTNCLETVKTTFLDKGIPVVIGEMSTSNYHNLDARVEWAKTYATIVKEAGIPCVLWDNNNVDDPKNQGESHGYLNRSDCTWYPQSEALIDTFLDIFNDPSSKWGEEAPKPVIDHEDINSGTSLFKGPKELDKDWGNDAHNWQDSIALEVDYTKQLEGKDVAVKFSGTTPVAAFSDVNYKGWTEVKAYDVDKEKGIAYFSMADLFEAWGDSADKVNHLSIKTTDHSIVDSIVTIKAAEHENTDKTRKFKIKLDDRKNGEDTIITFKGAANSAIEGAVGYADASAADGWTQVSYKGKMDANGVYTVVMPYGKDGIPGDVAQAEAQIWYCDDPEATMSYSFGKAEQPTEPAPTEAPTLPPTEAPTLPPTEAPTQAPTQAPTLNEDPGYGGYCDVNADYRVTMADAAALIQYLANGDKYKIDDHCKVNADVDEKVGLTTNDALVIMQVVAGLLPIENVPLFK